MPSVIILRFIIIYTPLTRLIIPLPADFFLYESVGCIVRDGGHDAEFGGGDAGGATRVQNSLSMSNLHARKNKVFLNAVYAVFHMRLFCDSSHHPPSISAIKSTFPMDFTI